MNEQKETAVQLVEEIIGSVIMKTQDINQVIQNELDELEHTEEYIEGNVNLDQSETILESDSAKCKSNVKCHSEKNVRFSDSNSNDNNSTISSISVTENDDPFFLKYNNEIFFISGLITGVVSTYMFMSRKNL
jgi:hypothetical protein